MKKIGTLLAVVTMMIYLSGYVQAEQRLSIDLRNSDQWDFFEYSRIKPNTYKFSPQGLMIDIQRSASPLFYRFDEPLYISSFQAKAKIFNINIEKIAALTQEKRLSDSPFRVGFVLSGARKLGPFERMIAPTWVKKIFELAPPEVGISHVDFFSTAWHTADLNKKQERGYENLIHESWQAVVEPTGEINMRQKTHFSAPILALWISADGDDLGIDYQVQIQSLEVEFPDA